MLLCKQMTDDVELSPPAFEVSLQEAEARVPFKIKQPVMPFEVTEQSTRQLETNGTYNAVEITYVQKDENANVF